MYSYKSLINIDDKCENMILTLQKLGFVKTSSQYEMGLKI